MTTRLSAITAFLTAAHAVLFGLFWLLLSVPESNVAMLIASALVVLLGALVFGWAEAFALLAWRDDSTLPRLPARALGGIPGVWIGTAIFLAVWLVIGRGRGWWVGHQGEIDAWLMVTFGWASTGKLHAVVGWLLRFASHVVGLSLGLSLASAVVVGGPRAVARAAWLRRAFGLRRLAAITGIVVVFGWLVAQGVSWRPRWLSPNWQEAVFVSAKLGVLYLLGNIGWALALGSTRKDG
jgi:hypothetical protein